MVALSAISAAHAALPPVYSPPKASGNSAATVSADQASSQFARYGVTYTTAQLSSDEAPRGSPGTINADQAAVNAAQQAAVQAASKLNADQGQATGVDVLA